MRFNEIFLEQPIMAPATAAPAANPVTAPAVTKPGQTMAQVQQDPQAQAKMIAQQALDRQNKKKELQDAIKSKQQEIQDLQKQLAAIK